MKEEQKMPRELIKIERRLQEALQPVAPPAAFVKSLGSSLDREMAKKLRTKRVKNNLLIAGGVLGAVALVITIIRSLTSWEEIGTSISKLIPRFRKREPAASI